jgi:hypothetical protein
MRKLMLSVAAGVVGLTLAGTANADHRGHGGHRGHERSHVRDHGVRFRGGYYYHGRTNHFWTRRVWDARYRRYQYWNPSYNCYYYYYAPADCYYPVSYCP